MVMVYYLIMTFTTNTLIHDLTTKIAHVLMVVPVFTMGKGLMDVVVRKDTSTTTILLPIILLVVEAFVFFLLTLLVEEYSRRKTPSLCTPRVVVDGDGDGGDGDRAMDKDSDVVAEEIRVGRRVGMTTTTATTATTISGGSSSSGSDSMDAVVLQNIKKSYPNGTVAVKGSHWVSAMGNALVCWGE